MAKIYTLHGEQLAISHSSITESPTLDEEYPWGITMERTADNVVQNKPPFRGKWFGYTLGNNFCIYGKGSTLDGEHEMYFGGCMNPDGGVGWAVNLDGEWLGYPLRVSLPLRYDDGDKYPYPTVYSSPAGPDMYTGAVYTESAGPYIVSSSYNYPKRQWIWQCRNTNGSGSIVINMIARGAPLWYGKPKGPYTMFGIASPKARESFNIWGGFMDHCTVDAKLKHPTIGEFTFKGFAIKDREMHKGIGSAPTTPEAASAGLGGFSYTWISIQQEDFDLNIYECLNPWTGEVWCRQGRINLVSRGLSLAFDDYKFSDNGGVMPTEFKLKGKYERGVVDITGIATEGLKIGYETGIKGKMVEGIPISGLLWPFPQCNGQITIDREIIRVSTTGLAEWTRMQVP